MGDLANQGTEVHWCHVAAQVAGAGLVAAAGQGRVAGVAQCNMVDSLGSERIILYFDGVIDPEALQGGQTVPWRRLRGPFWNEVECLLWRLARSQL